MMDLAFMPSLQGLGLETLVPPANYPTGIYDAEPTNESIEAVNGLMKVTIKGKKDFIIKQVDGRTTCYTLEMDKYCWQAKVNLFSLTALSKGGVLSSDDQYNVVINQDGMKIVFD